MSTDEIPTEALQAARDKIYAAAGLAMAQAYTVQTGGPCACSGMPWPSAVVQAGLDAALTAAAPYLIAEGRRQGIAQVFAPKATEFLVAFDEDEPVVDETPALMARYERELRCKIAAEIRAEAQREIDTQGSWFWFVHGEAGLKSGAEWAARIAEGADDG